VLIFPESVQQRPPQKAGKLAISINDTRALFRLMFRFFSGARRKQSCNTEFTETYGGRREDEEQGASFLRFSLWPL
jgi:hypothetical protein